MSPTVSPFSRLAGALFLLMLLSGCTTAGGESSSIGPPPTAAVTIGSMHKNPIGPGDLVTVDYELRIERDGPLVYATRRETVEDPAVEKVEWFTAPDTSGPEEVVAGEKGALNELAQAVIGMRPGERRDIVLPPAKGYGPSDPGKVIRLPLVKTIPRKSFITPKDYVSRFGTFPVAGQKVQATPYFPSEILEVTEDYVALQCRVETGHTEKMHPFGKTLIEVDEKAVTMTLVPTIGADFELNGNKGRIVNVDETHFSVDFNHPAAGRSLAMEVTVVAVEPAERFADRHPAWIEDHDLGYNRAAEEKKPMVMVLYAPWCGWCKKMMGDTIEDPRIQKIWDRFVWVKVDSDTRAEYKALYEQSGFPMTVMTDARGEILGKLDGFRDARAFRQELDRILERIAAAPAAS